jgi:hypothetical protein
MSATILAAGEGWDFVLVGSQVYRVRSGWSPDATGFPMGARWECSREHWARFRAIYDWVEDAA